MMLPVHALFVLVHSPLVGPVTWSTVAEELRRRYHSALVPALDSAGSPGVPYWRQHAGLVVRSLEALNEQAPIVLVGHSGAGPLLPAVQHLSDKAVAACIFVDAGLPHPGRTRLQEMDANAPEFAAALRQRLSAGRRYPEWSEEDLRPLIPDPSLRAAVLRQLHPQPAAYFEEPLPAFDDQPHVPSGYLKFSEAYDGPAVEARRRGLPYREIGGGHFHMLVDPAGVTDALVDLLQVLR